jgi:hypothetical protein
MPGACYPPSRRPGLNPNPWKCQEPATPAAAAPCLHAAESQCSPRNTGRPCCPGADPHPWQRGPRLMRLYHSVHPRPLQNAHRGAPPRRRGGLTPPGLNVDRNHRAPGSHRGPGTPVPARLQERVLAVTLLLPVPPAHRAARIAAQGPSDRAPAAAQKAAVAASAPPPTGTAAKADESVYGELPPRPVAALRNTSARCVHTGSLSGAFPPFSPQIPALHTPPFRLGMPSFPPTWCLHLNASNRTDAEPCTKRLQPN